MNSSEVRELGRRFVEEYAGGGKAEAADNLLADDFEAFVPARQQPIRGRESHIEMNTAWHQAIPDFVFNLEGMAVDGAQVVVRFSWKGTHTGGELMGVQPSGHKVAVRNEVHWLEAHNGLLIRDHALMDLGNLVAQLRGEILAKDQ